LSPEARHTIAWRFYLLRAKTYSTHLASARSRLLSVAIMALPRNQRRPFRHLLQGR